LRNKGLIVVVGLAFLLSVSISLAYSVPIAQDFHFHLGIAKLYAKGENALFNAEAFGPNQMPYPPLLHLVFVPFIWFGCVMEFGRVLQCFFYPLALFSCIYLVHKNSDGGNEALYCGLLLMSSTAFFDHSIQVIPQAIDMICYPLAVHFFLKEKMLSFMSTCLIMVYAHGLIALLLFTPFILHELITFQPTKTSFYVILTSFLSFPILTLSLTYLLPGLQYHLGGIQNAQEAAFLAHPLSFTIFYLGPAMLILSPFLIQLKNPSNLQKLAIYTILALTPMLFFWPDRFLTYVTMPLAILISTTNIENPRLKLFYIFILTGFAGANYLSNWYVLVNKAHHIVMGG